ncbi:hypothetical protein JWG44_20120 [Leptospira sp. 201903071]|nr:hypothetical protein [Leptospira ainazelensis]
MGIAVRDRVSPYAQRLAQNCQTSCQKIGQNAGNLWNKGYRLLEAGSDKLNKVVVGATTKIDKFVQSFQKEKVYRVYGDGAKAAGKSWTPVDPNTVTNFRDLSGLPNSNSGRFVIEGTVRRFNIIKERAALALDGNQGGIKEYIIEPAKVVIKKVSGVNPEF